jgi:serine/threonine protein kinase
MDEKFADVGDEWSRPWRIARVLGALGIQIPSRLRRERLSSMTASLQARGFEVVLANYERIDSVAPSIEMKIRLRRKPLILFSKYRVLQQFASGGMSEGFKVRTEDGTVYFLKRVRASGKLVDAMRRELGVYSKLERAQVNNVLAFHTFERDDEYVALVTEFADGGTLAEYVKARGGLGVPEVKKIALQVASGLRELHGLEIVHRDLKPENILRAGGRWKLGDFGISKDLARLVTQGRTFKEHGSLDYAPPEQWSGTQAHPSADIFAFGKILVFMLTLQTNVAALKRESWSSLVRKCTATAPDDRPTLDEVVREVSRLYP